MGGGGGQADWSARETANAFAVCCLRQKNLRKSFCEAVDLQSDSLNPPLPEYPGKFAYALGYTFPDLKMVREPQGSAMLYWQISYRFWTIYQLFKKADFSQGSGRSLCGNWVKQKIIWELTPVLLPKLFSLLVKVLSSRTDCVYFFPPFCWIPASESLRQAELSRTDLSLVKVHTVLTCLSHNHQNHDLTAEPYIWGSHCTRFLVSLLFSQV